MLKIIRENLKLTQEQIAWYLRLSNSMVKKIELDKRGIPFVCHDAVYKIFKVLQDAREHEAPDAPPSAAGHYTRQMKRTYRRCRQKLERYTDALTQMQKSYADACFHLNVYQRLAQSLTPPQSKDDQAGLKWTRWMIEDTLHRLKKTDPAAQDFLYAEIAGLQSKMAVLEATAVFQSMMQTS